MCVCVLECWSWGKCLWPIIGWCVITISNLSWDVVLSSCPLGAWQHCKLICRQHNQLCLHQLISPPPIQWYHLQSLFCHWDLVSSLHKKYPLQLYKCLPSFQWTTGKKRTVLFKMNLQKIMDILKCLLCNSWQWRTFRLFLLCWPCCHFDLWSKFFISFIKCVM